MNNVKNISIKEFLAEQGILPKQERSSYGLYLSPFREEHTPSFKVDYVQNLWYDFGTGDGGSIVDLVMKLNGCSFQEVITDVNQYVSTTARQANGFSFHRNGSLNGEPLRTILNILPITHPKLVVWVRERGIELELANRYCKEIHYRNRDKDYFSVGFRNDKGGYELNNRPGFKSCIPPKDITTIRNNKDVCLVFEGFWDFLSYLTIQKIEKTKYDVAVLNSTTNLQKAMDFLKSHREVYTYLDNDEAGQKATESIRSAHSTVHNRSTKYAGYKDLNDYLCQKPRAKQKVGKKRIGLNM